MHRKVHGTILYYIMIKNSRENKQARWIPTNSCNCAWGGPAIYNIMLSLNDKCLTVYFRYILISYILCSFNSALDPTIIATILYYRHNYIGIGIRQRRGHQEYVAPNQQGKG